MYDTAQEANRSYYKVLSHAIAYKKYIDEKIMPVRDFLIIKKQRFRALGRKISG